MKEKIKDIGQLKIIATQVRRDILRMVYIASSGHPGGSLGCAELLTALYFSVMDQSEEFKMDARGEDAFVMSNGHISPLLYSVLARRGYFPLEELSTFRKLNSRLQGHPTTHEGLPGIRVATGSLGQGFSVGVGIALAKKMDNDPGFVFVSTGDGELQEGQIWEAAMFAPFHKLDNLIVIVDWNGQQIDGPNNEILSLGDLEGKWRTFGWRVVVTNGNDMESIVNALEEAKTHRGSEIPTVILMRTNMGEGVDFMMGTNKWHGKAPNKDQVEIALAQLEETLGDYVYNENYQAPLPKH
ncbi:MAG TPA: transketolase [Saprospiraceae bacterium]|jgi:transketolase|nr:MAG: transketolase [Candidatus Parvibacillus calidus]MCO5284180.1 transketolase [Saprospiraceae bacterium]MBK7740950.1 transketolase [Candidatus Parvibacillus calidus]WKZ61854.1 MAG: transketolase [Saprospiraceae bacterium]HMY84778.1 transketolase [Saprospiraceae bacterium]